MASASPTCSVIVPTRDRPSALARCLEALADQSHPADRFEVVVVDDGSTAEVQPVVGRFERRLGLTLARLPGSGPSAARNRGAKLASGSLLAFIDDDAAPDPGWLAALARRHAADPHRGLGGRTVSDRPGNPYALASQRIIELAYAHYNQDPSRSRFFAANNLALPSAGFREIGGFDTELRISEDRELCDRWVEDGRQLSFVPEALVSHTYPTTLRDFVTCHFRYGQGALAYQQARRRRGRGMSGIDASFYRDLLRRDAQAALGSLDLPRLGLLAAWQAAYTAGFGWAATAGRRRGRETVGPDSLRPR